MTYRFLWRWNFCNYRVRKIPGFRKRCIFYGWWDISKFEIRDVNTFYYHVLTFQKVFPKLLHFQKEKQYLALHEYCTIVIFAIVLNSHSPSGNFNHFYCILKPELWNFYKLSFVIYRLALKCKLVSWWRKQLAWIWKG